MNNFNHESFHIKELSWLHEDYQSLVKRYQSERPPQALLLSGDVGIGKKNLASALIKKILCLDKLNIYACGRCQSCIWYEHHHPDIRIINSSNEEIRVDIIRELASFSALTSEINRKVVLIFNAEQLNINAANSLLKILEEPPANFYFILVSSSPDMLPVTILSRCQKYYVKQPNRKLALNWLSDKVNLPIVQLQELLAISYHKPLKAYQHYKDDFFGKKDQIEKAFCESLVEMKNIEKNISFFLEHKKLFFSLFAYWLAESIKMSDNKFPERQILSLLKSYPRQLLLTKYEQLLKIQQLSLKQTRTDWELESWMITFC